jgi:hypothetical protein
MNPVCPYCGSTIDSPEVSRCQCCGALLASDTIGQPKTQTKQLSRRAVNVCLILFEVFALSGVITGGFTAQEPSVEFTLAPSLCAISLEDAASVLGAYSVSDLKTLTDLVARGKAFSLPEGIQLRILSRRDQVARVRVESGAHIGNACWVPKELVGHRIAR